MDTVDVEDAIDKALESAVAELKAAIVEIGEDAAGGKSGFLEVERRFSVVIVGFACRMLAVLLSLYDHDAKYVEHDGCVWRRKTTKEIKTYRSVWGEVQVERSVYLQRGRSDGPQLVPLEKQAGLVDGQWTPHCCVAISRMVQSVPAREAVANMGAVGLLPYSRSSYDRVAEKAGAAWEAEREELEDEVIEAFDIPEQARGISVGFDRVRMEMDETELDPDQWPNGRKQPREIEGRMAYCATVTLHDEDGEPLWTKRYGRVANQPEKQDVPGAGEWIIREQVAFDVDLLLEAAPRLKERKAALTDGGPELERIVDEDYPEWEKLCDIRHLSTYLANALKETDLEAEEREQKRRRWLRRLKRSDRAIETIESELIKWEGKEDVDEALTYIDNRRERMRYATAYDANLPIASGHVEATCKSLVEMRMRRSGQRWTKLGAQPILNLRILALSDIWDDAMTKLMGRFVDDTIARNDNLCERYAA